MRSHAAVDEGFNVAHARSLRIRPIKSEPEKGEERRKEWGGMSTEEKSETERDRERSYLQPGISQRRLARDSRVCREQTYLHAQTLKSNNRILRDKKEMYNNAEMTIICHTRAYEIIEKK